MPALSGHDSSNAVVQDHAGDGTDQEKSTTSNAVDERQNGGCRYQEDNVLDRGRVKVGVATLLDR